MEKWKQISKDIILWKKGIDKIIFVDENNTAALKYIAKKIRNNQAIEETEQFFTLTRCVIDKANYLQLREEFEFYYKNKKKGL